MKIVHTVVMGYHLYAPKAECLHRGECLARTQNKTCDYVPTVPDDRPAKRCGPFWTCVKKVDFGLDRPFFGKEDAKDGSNP